MQRRILILYGSETGQSEAISQQIYDQCIVQLEVLLDQLGIKVERFCLDQSEDQFSLEREQTVIFVVSTTGEGDPPENALKFYRRFRKRSLENSLLSNLWYTLLGLGDTNYERFANFGRQLDKRLQQLSAKQFYRTGFADDAVGLEIEVEPWIEDLFPAILNHFNIFTTLNVASINTKQLIAIELEMAFKDNCPIMQSNESLSQLNQLTLPLIPSKFQSFEIRLHETLPEKYESKSPNDFYFKSLPVMDSEIHDSTLISLKLLADNSLSEEISLTDIKTIIEAKFQVNDQKGLTYEAGDSFGFIVGNTDQEIQELLKCLNIEEKQDFYCEVVSPELFPHLPKISKINDLLKYYLEIRSVPKKSCLRHFADFCANPCHKRRLLELSCREGEEDYNRFVRKDSVSILEILQIFDSCRPPLDVLLANCPAFGPRYYSAANSQNPDNKNQFRIVFSVINFEAKNMRKGSQLMGVFTGTLFRLSNMFSNEDNVVSRLEKLSLESNMRGFKVFKRKNPFFKLSNNWNTPIIMVGPGTGVAPFIGFLEKRQQMLKEGTLPSAEWWLFYGCRNKSLDFIYKKELNQFLADKLLTRLYLCFSRQTQDESDPKYVQQIIVKESEAVYKLIDTQKAMIYVCGDVKGMASDVFNAFVKVIEQSGHQSREKAVKYLRDMQSDKRYLQDIWS